MRWSLMGEQFSNTYLNFLKVNHEKHMQTELNLSTGPQPLPNFLYKTYLSKARWSSAALFSLAWISRPKLYPWSFTSRAYFYAEW